jgi:hypothetical protein
MTNVCHTIVDSTLGFLSLGNFSVSVVLVLMARTERDVCITMMRRIVNVWLTVMSEDVLSGPVRHLVEVMTVVLGTMKMIGRFGAALFTVTMVTITF